MLENLMNINCKKMLVGTGKPVGIFTAFVIQALAKIGSCPTPGLHFASCLFSFFLIAYKEY